MLCLWISKFRSTSMFFLIFFILYLFFSLVLPLYFNNPSISKLFRSEYNLMFFFCLEVSMFNIKIKSSPTIYSDLSEEKNILVSEYSSQLQKKRRNIKIFEFFMIRIYNSKKEFGIEYS